ncbi:MAG TPA: FlgD immunoglobulin-like domain containing protein [Gaiellaceae bacterium]|nr:FlgD immunoglobulin-like domain containing protein [Gaiellaceae bacterium]
MSALVKPAPTLMALPRVTALLSVLALVVPGLAEARVTMSVREEPIAAARSTSGSIRVLPARVVPAPFNLVGLHWRGAGKVYFRTAGARGWSPWRFARPEAEDLPDPGSPEAKRSRGWKLGNPFWTGSAYRIQYRLAGEVDQLRSFLVRTTVSSVPRSVARATVPPIVRRQGWDADETIVRSAPWYADRIGFAVVHHTAGAQPSTPQQSAAIVRGIQRYHVKGNGWNDIGYNFLVDRFGQVFEGRAGGITRNVVGAHAQGFNTGSVGLAVLGTYSAVGIEQPAKDALVALLAWRLDVAHVDPASSVVWRSGGNPRYPTGTLVSLRAVSGHRDTGPTSCPGQILYGTLPELTALTAGVGLPKIYDPRFTGSVGQQIRFTARLSTEQSWTVTVTSRDGSVVASGSGTGSAVDWTWDATVAAPGPYAWAISAGAARPASGRLGADPPPPLALESVRADPAVVSPNGDGAAERSAIRFRLTVPASVTAYVRDAGGKRVATISPPRAFPAGRSSVAWKGGRLGGGALADGRYSVVLEAEAGTEQATRTLRVVIDRTLGLLRARPSRFSPNRDLRRDTAAIVFTLTRPAAVQVRIFRGSRLVTRLLSQTLAAGSQSLEWNGRRHGRVVADASYRAVVAATTDLGTRTLAAKLVLDATRPRISRTRAHRLRRGTRVRFVLSEPAAVRLWLGGRRFTVQARAGRSVVWRQAPRGPVRIVAWDGAANASRAVWVRLRG